MVDNTYNTLHHYNWYSLIEAMERISCFWRILKKDADEMMAWWISSWRHFGLGLNFGVRRAPQSERNCSVFFTRRVLLIPPQNIEMFLWFSYGTTTYHPETGANMSCIFAKKRLSFTVNIFQERWFSKTLWRLRYRKVVLNSREDYFKVSFS